MIGTLLIIILVLMLLGSIPAWPHSRNWGYFPSGGLGTILLILVILWLLGIATHLIGTVLIVLLILMLLGSLPAWPHSREWGYFPSGGFGTILIILLILWLLGRI